MGLGNILLAFQVLHRMIERQYKLLMYYYLLFTFSE